MAASARQSGNGSNKAYLKPSEVCQIVGVQPYVLRTWETEFPHIGTQTHAGQRVYRRKDVETIVRLKSLLFEEGLTIAGAKKRLAEDRVQIRAKDVIEPEFSEAPELDAAGLSSEIRTRLTRVRDDLRALLKQLS